MHVVHGHERVRVAAAPDDELVAVLATVLAMHDATETGIGIGIGKGTGVENASVRERGRMLLRMVVVEWEGWEDGTGCFEELGCVEVEFGVFFDEESGWG